jgi:hypothetical protein
MSVKNSVAAITVTSIDSSTVSGTYQKINSSGLSNPCFLVRIVNSSNKDVTISYDGSTDNDVIAANTTAQYPFQSNSQPNNNAAFLAKGTVIWVKGTAGTGNIYLSGYYQVIAN